MPTVLIYVIGPDRGPQKIGITRNVASRLDSIQCGCPFNLKVHATAELPDERAARKAELLAHRLLKLQRRRGEWFDVTPGRAAEIIRLAASTHQGPDISAAERLALMRESGSLTWDEYESAIAFQEVAELAARSQYKDGPYRGAGRIERQAMARAIVGRIGSAIRERVGGEALRVLVLLVVKGVPPGDDGMVTLRQALSVVAEKLENATSAKAA